MAQDVQTRLDDATQRATRTALVAFVGGAVLAGGNAVGIRITLRELAESPLWAAFLRFGLAAAILLVVMAVRGLRFPRGQELRGVLVYGVLVFGGAYAFAFVALLDIQAGAFQLIGAVVPLATLLLAVLQRQERLRGRAVAGSLLALAGVGVVSQASLGGPLPVPALLATLGGVLCFAQGAVVAHRYPTVDAVTTNAVAMAAGALVLLGGALVHREPLVLPRESTTWWALVYLAVVGSIVVFWLFLVVVRQWSASRAAYGFVLIPIATLLLSAWLDDERLGWAAGVGSVLVLGGVYVGALRRQAAEDGMRHDVPHGGDARA